ncbi:hypothetical protein DHEL01_v208785 [Diaporthe helianthi]|uniref:Uncharacterized protein n=1 Tax=Diaporthe helianthi TaxID=158607 RepID=A0A2P5HRH4_DIAHE|nr:hypothetical protein DHEL01_v208785 [Diaporthe helianthi]
MSKDIEKDVSNVSNWIEKLAVLDQQYGWDDEDCTGRSNASDAARKQEVKESRQAPSKNDNKNDTYDSQRDEDDYWDSEDEDSDDESWDEESDNGLLYDWDEEERKRDRAYFAEHEESCLDKDTCVLLPYRQADLPGTENVFKPVLMVTTPDGEELYPHDLEEYPEPQVTANQSKHLDPDEEDEMKKEWGDEW